MLGFAMPEAVDGKHVVSPSQLRQNAGIILPFHALAVHEHQSRAVIRSFGIVDRRTVDSHLLLDEACIDCALYRALIAVQIVIAVNEDGYHSHSRERTEHDCDNLADFTLSCLAFLGRFHRRSFA